MRRIEFPDGYYGMALPGGKHAVLSLDGQRLYTHQGTIATPPGIRGPLYVWITTVGGFEAIGQGWDRNVTIEWVANQGAWTTDLPVSSGMYGAIYDLTGARRINDGSWGAQGIRYIDPTQDLPAGRLVTGDATQFDAAQQLNDFTDLGDGLRIGQDNATDAPVVWDYSIQAKRLLIDPLKPDAPPDNARFIHAIRDGEDVAIQYHQPLGKPAVIVYATMAELRALPIFVPPVKPLAFDAPVLVATFFPSPSTPGQAVVVANGQDYRLVAPNAARIIATPNALDTATPPPSRLFGVYSDNVSTFDVALARAVALRTRLVANHDDVTLYPESMLSKLRRWDLPLIEFYWYDFENFISAEARWPTVLGNLLSRWGGDVGVVTQNYTMRGVRTLSEVEMMQRPMVDLVNRFGPRVKLVAPFADDRADGGQIARLHQCIVDVARATPGTPTFVPIPGPPPPVNINIGDMIMVDAICYQGTLPSGEANRVRLLNPADTSQVASVERDGTLAWKSAADNNGRFEAFWLPDPNAKTQIVAVNSANPGEPNNWHPFAGVDVSKA